jgi:hypothetical protein
MIRRTTWITLGVFGALLVAALVVRQQLESQPTPTVSPPPEPLWRVESADIATLTVENLKAGTVLQLTRDAGDLWQIVLPQAQPADAARVERAVAWVAAPTPRAALPDALQLADYGLEDPEFRVEIVMVSGERHEFSVGRTSPTGDSRYATTPGRSGVQILSLVGLEEVLNLEADLLPTATPEPTATPTPVPEAAQTVSATPTAEGTPGPGIEMTPSASPSAEGTAEP